MVDAKESPKGQDSGEVVAPPRPPKPLLPKTKPGSAVRGRGGFTGKPKQGE